MHQQRVHERYDPTILTAITRCQCMQPESVDEGQPQHDVQPPKPPQTCTEDAQPSTAAVAPDFFDATLHALVHVLRNHKHKHAALAAAFEAVLRIQLVRFCRSREDMSSTQLTAIFCSWLHSCV